MAKRLDIYVGTTHVGFTQKAEVNEELTNDTLPTFDGPVPDEGADPSYELTLDVLRYAGSKNEFLNLKKVIRATKNTPQPIKVVEQLVFASGEKGKYTQQVEECKLSSNKVTFDAETRTVSNLAFKGTKVREFMDDKEF